MAVALIMDFPGGTREQYDQVIELMQLGGKMPEHGLAHVAGTYEDGWRVIDVWQDAEAFARFRDEQIGPHTQSVGLAAPQVRMVEVDEVMRGEGDSATFAQVVIIPGLDAAHFAEMDQRILPDGKRPAAVVWHVHGPIDGGFCVVDTWTSKAERDRFAEERIRPAMQQAGLTAPPSFEEMDVEARMGAGSPSHAAA